MAAMQKLPITSSSSTTAAPLSAVSDVFPAGLRVLVVDYDVKSLQSLETMLRRCMYRVTACSQASVALDLLREKKSHFDVVLIDVHMPDMDGFKLLELVGLEMDLPVIMMSSNERTSLVLRGIKHGACDYLIKPIREEELKKIWQHVVRKRWNGSKEHELSGSFDSNDLHKRGTDDTEYYASSVNEGMEGMLKNQKKKRDVKEEDDGELENDDLTMAPKRPRVVWSMELHEQFVTAVNQLGIDKAVPKRILELMNMPGLTRENVASHLQKFRLYLKKICTGVTQQPEGQIPNSFSGPMEQNPNIYSHGRFGIQSLTPSSARIPPQTLANMQAELLGHPISDPTLPQINQRSLLQMKLQRSKSISMDRHQPMMRFPINISQRTRQPIVMTDGSHSGLCSWPVSGNLGGLGAQNGCTIMGTLQPNQSIWSESSAATFQSGNGPASVNQLNGFNSGSVVVDYNCIVPDQTSNSSFVSGKMYDGKISATFHVENVFAGQKVEKSIPTHVPNMPDMHGSYNGNARQVFDQGMLPRNLGFVGKGTSIPSRLEVYGPESETSNLYQENYGDGERKVKQQDLSGDFMENLDWASSL